MEDRNSKQISKENIENNNVHQSSPIQSHSKEVNNEKISSSNHLLIELNQKQYITSSNLTQNQPTLQTFHVTEHSGYFSIESLALFSRLNVKRKYRILFYTFDWLFCIFIGLIGALIFKYGNVRGRLFRLDDPDISYPLVTEIVPFTHLIVFSAIIPVCMISIVNLVLTRNLHDFHHGVLGLLQSIAVSLILVSSFKCFIGGLRPNFLQICNPTPETIANGNPVGYKGIYFSPEICTADAKDINDALSAYPSGHSAISAAGLFFLALYLHAKLKTFNNRGHLVIFVLIIFCIISFLLIGTSRIADYRHSFGNVCCGWIIGISLALFTYKLNYRSVFGVDNHIPIIMAYKGDKVDKNNNEEIGLDNI